MKASHALSYMSFSGRVICLPRLLLPASCTDVLSLLLTMTSGCQTPWCFFTCPLIQMSLVTVSAQLAFLCPLSIFFRKNPPVSQFDFCIFLCAARIVRAEFLNYSSCSAAPAYLSITLGNMSTKSLNVNVSALTFIFQSLSQDLLIMDPRKEGG